MARPKKNADKVPTPAPAPVAVAPPQPMMPQGMPQGAPQFGHPQFQQVMPNQMRQQMPPPQPQQQPQQPLGVPGQMPPVNNEAFFRNFVTVRDSAVSRLGAMQKLLMDFTNDFMRQTNLLLGESPNEAHQNELLANFQGAAAQLMMPVPTELAPPAEEKKERKKRTHDPNAPKRPLTPYFLYMQHARSIIANDLGAEAPKGAVQDEGRRRWVHMSPDEKQGWNDAYQYNLRLYNAKVHSYKAGNATAKDMTDEESLKYANENGIPLPDMKDAAQTGAAPDDQDAIAEQLQQVAAAPTPDLADDNETKTPKKGATRKRRSEVAPEAATPASPDKKRRRSGKNAEVLEEPKKSGRKKTKGA